MTDTPRKKRPKVDKEDLLEEIEGLILDNRRDLGAVNVLKQLRERIKGWGDDV